MKYLFLPWLVWGNQILIARQNQTFDCFMLSFIGMIVLTVLTHFMVNCNGCNTCYGCKSSCGFGYDSTPRSQTKGALKLFILTMWAPTMLMLWVLGIGIPSIIKSLCDNTKWKVYPANEIYDFSAFKKPDVSLSAIERGLSRAPRHED